MENTTDRAFVLSERRNGVEIIRINRSRYHHSLNLVTLFQLHQAVDRAIDAANTHGILITTVDPGFVAGASIDFFLRSLRDDRLDRVHYFTDTGNACFDRIAESPKPVVALINGHAIGGGFELAMACRYRVALPNATFSLPETGLGLCPSWGGVVRLPALLGVPLAKWLVYSGKSVSSKEALALGIVDAVFPKETIFDESLERARHPRSTFQGEPQGIPDIDVLREYFGTRTADEIYEDSPERFSSRALASAVKQVKRNSILALRAAEEIMRSDMTDARKRAGVYTRINDELNRSEDTWLGLNWKQEKKIGFPSFPSKTQTGHGSLR